MVYDKLVELLNDLNNGTEFKMKMMSRKHVYRVKPIGRFDGDGWMIAHKIKKALNYLYLSKDNEISDSAFFDLPIHVYGKYVDVDIITITNKEE